MKSLRTLMVTVVLSMLLTYAAAAIQNFTFVQLSDTHAPTETSKKNIAALKDLGTVSIPGYGMASFPPSFIIVTGDMTEFGEKGWNAYEEFFQGLKIPHYDVLGNHDDTWSSLRNKLRDKFGSPYYSFDTNGCHFIMFESTMPQDPLPGFGAEELQWLKEDLKKVSPETPIFLALHHPLETTEFCNAYERYRLLEMFQNYNLALIMVGHGHSGQRHYYDGFDGVQGGSPLNGHPAIGYNLITISNSTLYVAYKASADSSAQYPLLKKSLVKKQDYPKITISSPVENNVITGSSFELKSMVYKFPGSIIQADYSINGGKNESLKNAGNYFTATINADNLDNGVHYLRVIYAGSQFTAYRTQTFIVARPGKANALWRTQLGGSAKSSPVLHKGIIYVGADDGVLYALDAKTGKTQWTLKTGGEILATPVISDDVIYIGSGDSNFYALSLSGTQIWKYRVESPIYSTAVVQNGLVYFGTKKGKVYALKTADGSLKWNNNDPEYCIEARLAYRDGVVYATAWDSYCYAINAETGKQLWKARAAGSTIRPGAKEYFSPADCSPVVSISSGCIFLSDRDWYLSRINSGDGSLSWYTTNCVAITTGDNGRSLLVRLLKNAAGHLRKIAADGSEIWTSPIYLNGTDTGRSSLRYTCPPMEKNGLVYAVSCWGTLYCVDGKDGKVQWQYQVTPQLPVMSVPEADDSGICYVSAMDGTITAIKASTK